MLCGAFTSRNYPKLTKINPKIAVSIPAKPSHCKSSFHKAVATEIYFETKPSTIFSSINIKCTGISKAIIKEGNKFNKMNFKKSSSGSSIYKTPSPAGIENER